MMGRIVYVLVLASLTQITPTNKHTVRELRLDPSAKYYVLHGDVTDDVRLCLNIPADKTLACVSAKEIRERYRQKHAEIIR